MNGSLVIRNRQRNLKMDARQMRRMIQALLIEQLQLLEFELGIYVVGEAKMTWLNETFLRHKGSTDVITFDYSAGSENGAPCYVRGANSRRICGEIFICADEALAQARRFRTTGRSELMRYVVHGVLHLRGYDDTQSRARRAMKRAENLHLRKLAARFDFR